MAKSMLSSSGKDAYASSEAILELKMALAI